MKKELEKIHIRNSNDLDYLIHRLCNGPNFAHAFVFDNNDLYNRFFDSIGIDVCGFRETYYYYDNSKNIHIAESGHGYVWISTKGLMAKSRITDNPYVNAYTGQKIVLIHLLDDAIELCSNEKAYDIDGALYSQIEELTPVLFHNSIFYFETMAKAYLSIYGKDVPHTHKLSQLLQLVKQTMSELNHWDTLFHAYVIPMFKEIVHHIQSIPGSFKEQFVKYDDNPHDITIVKFHPENLKWVRDVIEVGHDMVTEMYYEPQDCFCLHTGVYDRLMQKCKTPEQRKDVGETYDFLQDMQNTIA